MTSPTPDPHVFRFGVFELDVRSGELRRHGLKIRLPDQSFQILRALLMRPGEVVTRDELRQLLWTAETFVDFEVGLNSAVRKLREALDDSADNPRFVETVPRHGYRFVGPVAGPLVDPAPPAWTASDRPVEPDAVPPSGVAAASLTESLPAAEPIGPLSRTTRWRPAALLFVLFVGIGGVAYSRGLFSTRDEPTAAEPSLIRLTSNTADMFVTSAHIAPDGRHLAFADRRGLQVRSIDSGRVHRFADTEGMNVYGWTPDSASVLASQCDDVSCVGWVISLVGQDRHRLGTVWSPYEQVRVAPGGQRLLKLSFALPERTLAMDPMNGLPAIKLASGDLAVPNWSADGKRALFIRRSANTIESIPAEGGTPLEVYRAQKDQRIFDAIELPDRTILMSMLPPGAILGTSGQFELWRAYPDSTGVVHEPPHRLAGSIANATYLTASSAGRAAYLTSMTVSSAGRVAFLHTRFQSDVYVTNGDLRSGSLDVPRRFTLTESDNSAYAWTPDSSTVLLSSNRDGTWDIFKQRLDSDIAEPFRSGPRHQGYPGVTNDGRWVLYADGTGTDDSIMRTSLSGGAPAEVIPHVGRGRLQCAERGRCVLIESKDRSSVISSLDPFQGKGDELVRIPLANGFRLLPDGNAFAYIVPGENRVGNRVRVVSFTGKPDTQIVVKEAAELVGLGWLPSNAGFVSTDRGKLLLIFLDGTSKVLWAPTGVSSIEWAVPSPDEKHLVINVSTRHSNVWMVSGL
jgi:DNA-binding winged helix-turn-helix (wHTH) protein